MERPIWSDIESCIDRAFEYGGQVFLYEAALNNADKVELGTFISMNAHADGYLLSYTPETLPHERTRRCMWWRPGNEPFHGYVVFDDHPFDDRMVCSDVLVAKKMFLDFFDNYDLTEVSRSQLRSVWEPKPI